ncbi:hypothetical protein DFQ28_010761 [Apophysomyces sp. BC1034]|nr:hypothetical protein DFQ30_010501 [Apophysomyces sp. BC1015]KAG0170395.1 hypothetical protein DFQ29_009306 [Apophysomyces sp. BC1021]KAG0184659.1 hypothetical protein DFQ28_010761 [Apophysomyces sp. BC1034]
MVLQSSVFCIALFCITFLLCITNFADAGLVRLDSGPSAIPQTLVHSRSTVFFSRRAELDTSTRHEEPKSESHDSASTISSESSSTGTSTAGPPTDSSRDSTTTIATTTTPAITATTTAASSATETESKTTVEPISSYPPPPPPPPESSTTSPHSTTATATENETTANPTPIRSSATDNLPSTPKETMSTSTWTMIPTQTEYPQSSEVSGLAWGQSTPFLSTTSGTRTVSVTVSRSLTASPSIVFGEDACAADPLATQRKCPSGYFCTTASGRCNPLLADNASCDADDQCASQVCQGGQCFGAPSSLGGGAIAGIVVGSIVGAVLVILGAVLCSRRLQRRRLRRFHLFHNNESSGVGMATTTPTKLMAEHQLSCIDTSAYEDNQFYGDVALAALSSSSSTPQLRPMSHVSRSSTPDPYSSMDDRQLALLPPPRVSLLAPRQGWNAPFDYSHLTHEQQFAQPAELDAFQISRQQYLFRQSLRPLAPVIGGDAWSNEDRVSLTRPSYYSDMSSRGSSNVSPHLRQ